MTIRRRIMGLLGSVVLATIGMLALAGPAQAAEAAVGEHRWEPVANWPLIAIHAALDSKGRVVTYGTNGNGQQTGRFIYDVWTPSGAADQNHSTLNNTTQTDVFCSLQLNRPDTGDMLIFGGDNWNGQRTTNTGNNDINLYSADNRSLSTLNGMNRDRWYATGTTLIDGSFYIQGGAGGTDRPERWTAQDGSRLLNLDTGGFGYWYPKNWVTPSGHLFGFDDGYQAYTITPDLGTLTRHGALPWRSDAGRSTTAVMYEPGKILMFGGTSRSATIIDVTGTTPQYTRTDDLSYQRSWGDATVLPDGRVLATGGADKPSDSFQYDPLGSFDVAYNAEIWDPATGQWTVLPRASRSRMYHSTALLLPDGRVFTGGGGAPGPQTNTNAEIFRPDYLSKPDGSDADRPAITWMDEQSRRAGDSVSLSVEHNRSIDRVTLIKTGSLTHSFDMEQRFMEASFSISGNQVTVQLPSSGNVLTPGYYHLFVLDDLGVPSVARMVHIEASSDLPSRPRSSDQVVGGNGGTPFFDWPAENTTLTAIEVRADSWVRSLEAFTADGSLGRRGGTAGNFERITLNQGEYVTAVFGNVGQYLNSIGFETSTGRTFGPYGGGGGSDYRIEAPGGDHIVGFKGREGTRIDQLGVIFQERPDRDLSVVVYDNWNFDGTSWVLGTDGIFEDPAGWSNRVSSIRIPDGLRVQACTETGGGGMCNTYASSQPQVDGEFNDTYSYFRVSSLNDPDPDPDPGPGPDPGPTLVRGQVSDPSGSPGQVTVDLFLSNAAGERLGWITSTVTADDGTFQFSVEPGCWAVTFIAPDGRSFTNGSQYQNGSGCVESDQSVSLDAQLAPQDGAGDRTAIGGTVSGPNGPVSGVAVDLFAANADGSRGSYLASTSSAADGSYSFDVEPACHVVTFIAPDGQTFTNGSPWLNAPGCPEAGEILDQVNAALAVADGASISGTVAGPNGPVSGVAVDLFAANADGSRGDYLASTNSGADGSYSFDVQAGCFVTTFIAPDGQTFSNGSQWLNRPICVGQGDSATGIDATLS